MAQLTKIAPNLYAHRRGRLVFRRVVPTPLRKAFGAEIRIDLGDRVGEAKARVASLNAEFETAFRLASADGAPEEYADRINAIREAAQASIRAAEREAFAARGDGVELAIANSRQRVRKAAGRIVAQTEALQAEAIDKRLTNAQRAEHGDGATILRRFGNADQRLRMLELAGELPGPEYEPTESELFETFKAERALGEARAELATLAPLVGSSKSSVPVAERIATIDTERRRRKTLSEITTRRYDLFRRRWIEVIGDKSVKAITRADVEEFVDQLMALPNGNLLKPEQRSLPVAELIAIRADGDLPGIDAKSVQKTLDWLRAVLNTAVDKGLIQANPAARVQTPPSSRALADRRLPFTPTQLSEIHAVAEEVWRGDERLWYLRAAIYTGARPEELAQLREGDIKREGDVWYADVHDLDEDRRIKNAASVRCIPLHPALIKLGFLDFVATRAGKRLWPWKSAPWGSHLRATRAFNLSVLPKCASCLRDGSLDRRLTFYSIRHRFADACRNAGVADDARRRLMGHVEGGISGAYGQGFALPRLSAELAKIDPFTR